MQAKDPICGMMVTVEGARFHGTFGGVEVYFCSAACLKQYSQRHPPG